MPRTNSDFVKDALQDDYGPKRDGTLPSLATPIAVANSIVNSYVTDLSASGFSVDNTTLELIERQLSAFYYTSNDPIYASRSTEGRSGSFLREKSENPYKAAALALDPFGMLNSLLSQQRAGGFWGGKPLSDQLTYDERN